MIYGLWSSGRLGAMVTFTLKLGISILNGGNILVQQVRINHAACMHAEFVNIISPLFTVLLSRCRKCWTIWRKKETLAFSKVCLDWWCLAGNETITSCHTQNKNNHKTWFTFCFVSQLQFKGELWQLHTERSVYSSQEATSLWKQL